MNTPLPLLSTWTALLALLGLGASCQKPSEPPVTPEPVQAAPAAQAGPRIACAAPEHDFGAVLQGTQVKHSFSLQNQGDAPLKIKHVSSSCGSTVGKPAAGEVAPGGETKIDVTVDTSGRQGALEKSVFVYSNDTPRRRFELKISGTVEVQVGFEPPRLKLRNVLKGSRASQQLKLIGRDLANAKLQVLRTSDPQALQAKLVQVDGQPGLEVGFQAGPKPGRFEAEVVLQTGLPGQPEARLPVVVDATGDLVIDQEVVDFGLVSPTKPVSRTVRLWSLGGKPFEVKGVEDPDGLVAGKAQKSGSEFTLVLDAMRSGDKGAGEVIVRTDRKDQPEVRVPYHVRVFKRRAPAVAPLGRGGPGPAPLSPTPLKKVPPPAPR
ncbi:MAG TPA: DUF1573 domain-containing protein [Myxococcota bacterium]|nr:DUF1573 domain-containing protein [Myxococcota bacterium]HRY94200.1 DUF1573 domain-containing protein [Myxococcota bacterium]HSA20114.1 DUF1573 domain-containing protein [Myxococcota bacterium]